MSKWMIWYRNGKDTANFYLIAARNIEMAIELSRYFGERYKLEIVGITPHSE